MMYWGSHMTTWGWAFSVLGTLILVGLIVVAVVSFLSAPNGRGGSGAASGASAHEILDGRLARGELTVEQYDQLRATLGHGESAARGVRQPSRPANVAG
jgi:putative membrane protein